jgi:hypothetical protein
MSQAIHLELEVPDDLARMRLPDGVQQRLTALRVVFKWRDGRNWSK